MIKLLRATSDDSGTVGSILFQGRMVVTLERPWVESPLSKGGMKGISCVPEGIYVLERHSTELHPHTYALVNHDLNVRHWPDLYRPNARTCVLIHAANYISELRGCIAPGIVNKFSVTHGHYVEGSRIATSYLLNYIEGLNPIDRYLEITKA